MKFKQKSEGKKFCNIKMSLNSSKLSQSLLTHTHDPILKSSENYFFMSTGKSTFHTCLSSLRYNKYFKMIKKKQFQLWMMRLRMGLVKQKKQTNLNFKCWDKQSSGIKYVYFSWKFAITKTCQLVCPYVVLFTSTSNSLCSLK